MTPVRLAIIAVTFVVGTGIAIYWANRLFERREAAMNAFAPDQQAPQPRRPDKSRTDDPRATRSNHRTDFVVMIERAATETRASELVLVIRGNGEFARLPRPGEGGPIVTGVALRSAVDAAIVSAEPLNAASRPTDAPWILTAASYAANRRVRASDQDVDALLRLEGASLERNAIPDAVFVRTREVPVPRSPAESQPTWPFRFGSPDRCLAGALMRETDGARMKAALLVVRPGAVFVKAGRGFEVTSVDLITRD